MSDHTKTTAPALGKLLTMSEDNLRFLVLDESQVEGWSDTELSLYTVMTELDAQRREVARLTEDRERLRAENGYLAFRHRMATRTVERYALCPDHRDKATGYVCIVCKFERSAVREALDAARAQDGAK